MKYLILGLLGLIFGSFATVLTYRVPLGQSILSPGSRCVLCGTKVAKRHLVPVFSYVQLKGKTKCCGKRISLIYPGIELVTALLFLISFHKVGTNFLLLPLLVLSIFTMPLILIDLMEKRLPNLLTLSGLICAILISLLESLIQSDPIQIASTLFCSLFSALFFLLLNIISKGGMGMGDVKLAAMIGGLLSFFGAQTVFVSFVFAFLLGAVVGLTLILARVVTRKTLIPFGPFMILGAWISILLGPEGTNNIANFWNLSS